MTATTEQAQAFLRQQRDDGSTAWKGLCLKLQRYARGIPPLYPDAETAGDHVENMRDDRTPPIGAFMWWHSGPGGSGHGHVASYAGNGLIWTNDEHGDGRVSLAPAAMPENVWGQQYRGWSDNANGVTVPLEHSYPDRDALEATLRDAWRQASALRTARPDWSNVLTPIMHGLVPMVQSLNN